MNHGKPKKSQRNFCPKCSIKFQRRRLICPFCRTLMKGNLAILIVFAVGAAAILLTVYNTVDYF